MNKYVITTDYTADNEEAFYDKTGIQRLILPFSLNHKEYDIRNTAIPFHDYFNGLRAGQPVSTSQTSQFDAKEIFIPHLKKGLDIIHFCFSSGVSSSYVNFEPTVKELKKEFPNNTVYVVDTVAGAGALGIFVDKAYRNQQAGMSFSDIVAWAEDYKLKLRHYFIVDDLKYLKKSGRLSGIEATVGSILGIKPVLTLNTLGKIHPVAKPRGTKKAFKSMRDNMIAEFDSEENDYIIIQHGDNLESAQKLAEIVGEAFDVKVVFLNINYLIGAHAGPDCAALFFVAKTKRVD